MNTRIDAGKFLPARYRMEIYVGSLENVPDATFYSSTPFNSIHAGDLMEPSLWPHAQYGVDYIAKVTAVSHLIWEIEGSHIGNSISVCVKIEKK